MAIKLMTGIKIGKEINSPAFTAKGSNKKNKQTNYPVPLVIYLAIR